MIRSIAILMRPGDWVKNVFVLPAFMFALPALLRAPDAAARVTDAAVATAVAFLAYCAIASGFYCINDAIDHERDRAHPRKRHRPVAAGAVRPGTAVAVGVVLVAAGLAGGFARSTALGMTLLLYVLLQGLYNTGLKRIIFVDVAAVAIGFGLRAAAGAVAIGVQVSIWMLLCVFFLCLYLGFVKRLCDLHAAAAAGSDWHPPAGYDDEAELAWLLAVSGVMAVMTWVLYTLSGHAQSIFGTRVIGLALLTPLVLVVIHRFYRRAREGRSDSPLAALREDPTVLVAVILFVAGIAATLYVPAVAEGLSDLLFVDAMGAAP